MHVGDTIFIFCLALIIFGPKKLPEIGRQIGKLMVEFRRASNEFKMQIDEELRAADEAERQKEINASTTMLPTSPAASALAAASVASESGETSSPEILPPATGIPVNHTFAVAEDSPSGLSDNSVVEEAFKEAPADFNSHLNTASNGLAEAPLLADQPYAPDPDPPASSPLETVEPQGPDSEKAQATLHHG